MRRRTHGRTRAVDVGVDRQRGLDLRKFPFPFAELDAVDGEQAAVGRERAPANVDEVAQAEEKVGELEEVAVEDDGDRHDLIPAQRSRPLRHDRIECDPALPRDVRELEDHPRLVGLIGHRLGQLEEVCDANLLCILRLCEQGARIGDLVLLRGDLRREVGSLTFLRFDQAEVADRRKHEEHDHSDPDLRGLRQFLLAHEVAPGARTLASILKWTTERSPRSACSLFSS